MKTLLDLGENHMLGLERTAPMLTQVLGWYLSPVAKLEKCTVPGELGRVLRKTVSRQRG